MAVQILILTVQRTGGTNLTEALRAVLGAGQADHEPFQPARKWGWIATDFDRTGDAEALSETLARVLAGASVVKHCCEFNTDDFNGRLVDAARRLNYRLLVHFREDEVERSSSRLFAEATGIFSRHELLSSPLDREALATRMRALTAAEVEEQIAQATRCAASLGAAVDRIERRGYPYVLQSYEGLYLPRGGSAIRRFRALLAELGVTGKVGRTSRREVRTLLNSSGQGSRDLYPTIAHRERLSPALRDVWAPLARLKKRRLSPENLMNRIIVEWRWRGR